MELFELDPELKSHFINLYYIALSDTQVDTTELEFLFNFGQERGIAKEEIEKLILHPDKVKFSIPSDTLKKVEYLYDFARIIWADGKVDEYEVLALKKFCSIFGFEESNIPFLSEFLLDEVKKETDKSEIFDIVKKNL